MHNVANDARERRHAPREVLGLAHDRRLLREEGAEYGGHLRLTVAVALQLARVTAVGKAGTGRLLAVAVPAEL